MALPSPRGGVVTVAIVAGSRFAVRMRRLLFCIGLLAISASAIAAAPHTTTADLVRGSVSYATFHVPGAESASAWYCGRFADEMNQAMRKAGRGGPYSCESR